MPYAEPADMRTPRLLAAAQAQLRRPALQSRLSSAKQMTSSLLSSTKEYLANKDYRGAYEAVSSTVKSKVKETVGSAYEYASGSGSRDAQEDVTVEGGQVVVRKRQTWDEWARERRRRRREEQKGIERVWLFPGWAVRRATHGDERKTLAGPFTLELHISGYCTSLRPPEQASRAQRAFMRVARSFSSLPKLPAGPSDSASSTSSAPSSAPGTPLMSPLSRAGIKDASDEEVDPFDLDAPGSAPGTPRLTLTPKEPFTTSPLPSPSGDPIALDFAMPKGATTTPGREPASYPFPSFSVSLATPPIPRTKPPPLPPRSSFSQLSLSSTPSEAPPAPSTPTGSQQQYQPPPSPKVGPSSASSTISYALGELRTLHANLEARLQPFWSSALPARRVRLTITLPPLLPAPNTPEPSDILASLAPSSAPLPLLTQEITTNPQGYFEQRLKVPWERIADALRHVGGDLARLQGVEVRAELLPSAAAPNSGATATESISTHTSTPAPTAPAPPILYPRSLSHPPALRVISDIDDTVKHTSVLSGAKAVFHNVFVRHLDELVLPGVGEWYREMEARGVGFHYVSNSPFELLPVIKEFFGVAGLPHGSIKLKYYSPTAVFHGLWEPAGERKRGGVVEILDTFPASKFILIGDTGEQDMELYVALARERPAQITAIFLRDVTPLSWTEGGSDSVPSSPRVGSVRGFKRSLSSLELPKLGTSAPASGSGSSSRSASPGHPARRSTFPAPPSPIIIPATPSAAPATAPSSVSYFTPANLVPPAPQTQAEAGAAKRKAAEAWRLRLEAAKRAVPPGIPFRVFRTPEECVEWRAIVDRWAGT